MITKLSYDVPSADRLGLEAQPNRVMQTRVRKWSEDNECSVVRAICINEERRWEFDIKSEKPLTMGGTLPQFLTVVDTVDAEPVVEPAPEPVQHEVVDTEPVIAGRTEAVSEVESAEVPFIEESPMPEPVETPKTNEIPTKKKKRGRPSKKKS